VPRGTDPGAVLAVLRANVGKILGNIPVESPQAEADPPLLIPTREGDQHLLFAQFRLTSTDARVMRDAIDRLNSEQVRGVFGEGVQVVAATPNWFGAAQQYCEGGSPASYPVPARTHGARVRYAPQLRALDLAERASEAANNSVVRVAVLDTAPEDLDLAWALNRFQQNLHLHDLRQHLDPPLGKFLPSQQESARSLAIQQLAGFHSVEFVQQVDVRDHGLFVAGVVHAAAPWVRIRLIQVLNNYGAGSLHALVIGLVGLLQERKAGDHQVINLSLGMLPPQEQLASTWFGLSIEGLPGCPEEPSLQFVTGRADLKAADISELIKRNDPSIATAVDPLHAPVRRLMEVLQAHDCVVVAAAGNDSVFRGAERRPRWSPRIPAVYDSVLGVAAAVRPGVPARYSNRGEVPTEHVRDAVATLGGDLAPDGVSPAGGVISVFSSEEFPPLPPASVSVLNDAGWAEWSGTSFATPILSGIAANLWSTQPAQSAAQIVAALNAEARSGSSADVADLGVPGVPVRLVWLP
jgi:hypothetical protein